MPFRCSLRVHLQAHDRRHVATTPNISSATLCQQRALHYGLRGGRKEAKQEEQHVFYDDEIIDRDGSID